MTEDEIIMQKEIKAQFALFNKMKKNKSKNKQKRVLTEDEIILKNIKKKERQAAQEARNVHSKVSKAQAEILAQNF